MSGLRATLVTGSSAVAVRDYGGPRARRSTSAIAPYVRRSCLETGATPSQSLTPSAADLRTGAAAPNTGLDAPLRVAPITTPKKFRSLPLAEARRGVFRSGSGASRRRRVFFFFPPPPRHPPGPPMDSFQDATSLAFLTGRTRRRSTGGRPAHRSPWAGRGAGRLFAPHRRQGRRSTVLGPRRVFPSRSVWPDERARQRTGRTAIMGRMRNGIVQDVVRQGPQRHPCVRRVNGFPNSFPRRPSSIPAAAARCRSI
jgi:hypothetical protein